MPGDLGESLKRGEEGWVKQIQLNVGTLPYNGIQDYLEKNYSKWHHLKNKPIRIL